MTRTWGLFAWVREKRVEEPAAVPPKPEVFRLWEPGQSPVWRFDILDVWNEPGLDLSTYKGGGWVPSPYEPGALVQYRNGPSSFSPNTDPIGYRDGYSRDR